MWRQYLWKICKCPQTKLNFFLVQFFQFYNLNVIYSWLCKNKKSASVSHSFEQINQCAPCLVFLFDYGGDLFGEACSDVTESFQREAADGYCTEMPVWWERDRIIWQTHYSLTTSALFSLTNSDAEVKVCTKHTPTHKHRLFTQNTFRPAHTGWHSVRTHGHSSAQCHTWVRAHKHRRAGTQTHTHKSLI